MSKSAEGSVPAGENVAGKRVRKRIGGGRGRELSRDELKAIDRVLRVGIESAVGKAREALDEIDPTRVPDEMRSVAERYWAQADQTLTIAQKWLRYLSDDEVIREKFEKTPPHVLAVTYSVLSDQVLKRLKEFREIAKEIKGMLEPQKPVIEIVEVDPSQDLVRHGLGLVLRYAGYRDGRAEFVLPVNEVKLGGRTLRLPPQIEIPAQPL